MEQYSRRQCFRIEGIVKPHKGKTEGVINLVKECFAKADVDIPDAVLVRSHRISPVYQDESDQNIQGIIVKFNNFRFYKSGKKLKREIKTCSDRPNKQSFEKTNALIKPMKMENIVYTFADVSSIDNWRSRLENHKMEKRKFPNLLILNHLQNYFKEPPK